VLLPRYMSIKVDSHSALCSKSIFSIYGNKVTKIIQQPEREFAYEIISECFAHIESSALKIRLFCK